MNRLPHALVASAIGICLALCIHADAAAADPGRGNRTDSDWVPLFDAQLRTMPAAQGWTWLTTPLQNVAAIQKLSAGGVLLDTLAKPEESAGYFGNLHPRLPKLDRTQGYRILFQLRVEAEQHRSNDRAGFSVITLASDGWGIELGFWAAAVFAQSGADFRMAERTRFDTLQMHEYELNIRGDGYELRAAKKKILEGPLRDYSTHPHPVYRLKNLLFLGDDTRSAAARVELGSIAVRGAGL